MRSRHLLTQEKEKEDDEKWENTMKEEKYTKIVIDNQRKEREKEKKRKRLEEKKTGDISLLEFTRQVVVLTVKKHGEDKDTAIVPQCEASAMLSPVRVQLTPGGKLSGPVLQDVRYDSGRHLPKKTSIHGVCKECRRGPCSGASAARLPCTQSVFTASTHLSTSRLMTSRCYFLDLWKHCDM
jgi:hypothetical protein